MVDWLSLSQLSGSGDTEVTVTASSYSDFYERYTQLTVSGVTKSVRIPVNQYPDVQPMDGEYLTIECIGSTSGVLTLDGAFDYSVNGGTWHRYDLLNLTIQPGDKVRFRSTYGGFDISDDGASRYRVYGNTMSLYYEDDFQGKTTFPINHQYLYSLSGMFYGFTGLVDATCLVLPALSMDDWTYAHMFQDCVNLLHGPKVLPATVLSDGCYSGMFAGCISLLDAPELPATDLKIACYAGMFRNCSSFVKAPILPASGVARAFCYEGMFAGCTSLTTAPELPATTMSDENYPIFALHGRCYAGMFSGCTNLTTAPELPATTLSTGCYMNMFAGCTSLTTAPELPVMTLMEGCYTGMFSGCTRLTTAPELPAMTLAKSCYESMFRGCTSITAAPELPAMTLDYSCYALMFQGCTSLIESPVLPAPTLVGYPQNPDLYEDGCYYRMFSGCTNLSKVVCYATYVGTWATRYWLSGVSANGIFIKSSQTTSWTSGVDGIPNNWTVVNV